MASPRGLLVPASRGRNSESDFFVTDPAVAPLRQIKLSKANNLINGMCIKFPALDSYNRKMNQRGKLNSIFHRQ